MSSLFALIVEDTKDIANYFSLALKTAGFQTEVILTGDAALERLKTVVPDIVVLDLHLPEVMGTEILRAIRADARLANTQVIVITADALTAETIQDKADLVLIKPVGLDQLGDLATRLTRDRAEGKELDFQ
ncbi:MAG: response regulator [Anaerolineae bacterium]|nr:response regulator [Anaerolineae bacterium]